MKKILFNDKYGLTKAVLEGRKTQTRRIVPTKLLNEYGHNKFSDKSYELIRHSHFKVGEDVAVAQPYKDIELQIHVPEAENEFEQKQAYHIYGDTAGWHNKMFVKAVLMPHRIKITNIRVERLQDISDEDCLTEGVMPYDDVFGKGFMLDDTYNNVYRRHCFTSPRKAFASLIDKTCGKGTWDKNPWVFVYDFKCARC